MTQTTRILTAGSAAVLFAVAAPAGAAGEAARQPLGGAAAAQPARVDLAQWAHHHLRGALSAEQLMAAEVRGQGGERLGRIEEIFVGPHGGVTSVGLAVGGFLGIARSHLRVAWDQLALGPDMQDVRVPLAPDDAPRFAFFDRAERMPGERRVTELLRAQAVLADGTRYGPVNDLIISRNGRVQALIVSAAGLYVRGQRALPISAQALHAAERDVIATPIDPRELFQLPPFDYQAMDILPRVTGRLGTGIGGIREAGAAPPAAAPGEARAVVPGRVGLAEQARASRDAPSQAGDPRRWDLSELHGSLSIERLRGLEVRGRGNERVGAVHDVVIGAGGRITAFGIGVGGVAGIARNILRVPAAQVRYAPGLDHLVVPLSSDDAGGFALFDRVELRAGEWRASELLRGHVITADGARYGPIVDLIVDRRGALRAVVADARILVGMRALPFHPAGLALREREYRVGYHRSELDNSRPFDYVGLAIGPIAGADARVGVGVGGTTDGAATGRLGPAGAQRTH